MPIIIIAHVHARKGIPRGMGKSTIMNGLVLILIPLLDVVWESLCLGGTPSIPCRSNRSMPRGSFYMKSPKLVGVEGEGILSFMRGPLSHCGRHGPLFRDCAAQYSTGEGKKAHKYDTHICVF